jgi:hypothetical protein
MHRLLILLFALGPLALPAASAEPVPAWLAPPATVSVDCGRAALDLVLFERNPIEGEPVHTNDPGCICPHAGPGWIKVDDTCVFHPETRECTGICIWENTQHTQGRSTPCGSP